MGSVGLLAGLALPLVATGIVCAEPGLLETPFLAQPLDETAQPFEATLDSTLVESAFLENTLRDNAVVAGTSNLQTVGSVPLSIISAAPARAWIGDEWMWNLEDTGAMLPQPTTPRSAGETSAMSLLGANWRIGGKPGALVLVATVAGAAAILLLVILLRAV